MEKVQGKYARWMLGLSRETPGYIVREEGKREKIRIEAGKRAVKFEDRIKDREGCEILKES